MWLRRKSERYDAARTERRGGSEHSDCRVVSGQLTRCVAVLAWFPLTLQVIEHHLRGRDYNEALLPQWINDIAESCMEELHAPKKPFKYIVSVCIMQRTGAGIHCAKACYWDTVSDGQEGTIMTGDIWACSGRVSDSHTGVASVCSGCSAGVVCLQRV